MGDLHTQTQRHVAHDILLAVFSSLALVLFLGFYLLVRIYMKLWGIEGAWWFDDVFLIALLLWFWRNLTVFLSRTRRITFLLILIALPISLLILFTDPDTDGLMTIHEVIPFPVVFGSVSTSGTRVTNPFSADTNQDLINDRSNLYNHGLWRTGYLPRVPAKIPGELPSICKDMEVSGAKECQEKISVLKACLDKGAAAGRSLGKIGNETIACADLDTNRARLSKNLDFYTDVLMGL